MVTFLGLSVEIFLTNLEKTLYINRFFRAVHSEYITGSDLAGPPHALQSHKY